MSHSNTIAEHYILNCNVSDILDLKDNNVDPIVFIDANHVPYSSILTTISTTFPNLTPITNSIFERLRDDEILVCVREHNNLSLVIIRYYT